TGRGLAPTSRAQELKPVISEALDRCRHSLAIASPDATTFHGRAVSIGLSDDFEVAIGRRIIETLETSAPGLRIIFRQTHSQIVADVLANQDMDLAVAAGAQRRPRGTHSCPRRAPGGSGRAKRSRPPRRLTLGDYVSRGHILVSSGGVVGIVDEGLAARGLKRNVVASTTHFAALPFLLKGTRSVATIPRHAAEAIARVAGLKLLACPIDLPRYPVELGWRNS
ncbi:LysR substrate-binding domain-containing protein, partial [Paraburkholderia sp. CNPSo 3076]|uniref:LysR substrate-binding domain-containing protein n=1 Tax=Paraburkholderia sp. CNPSo 3076 TaxID=2940936 RepID=UPI002256A64F